ncbi:MULTISPECIES: cytosylglucuronate decarboxylase [Streptomyces]|uniref:Cytosylglucuronate decarboxylase n=2 Tax=Streptomyces TaxID=1883 RepID=A0A117IX06_9ACTN|nr:MULTISPECIES: cytosylglucuronate decarboxylase [Streptomyces]KUH39770.1 cytosylglucuronate decarboxylase [Streptomyces kanasensis]UUS34518.1 cytosylglucuronate decarboxylase [Streptomyces changanensis]
MRERQRYLFIRILEACNADCFMCEFALSRDTFRFSLEDFTDLLPKARDAGVGYVRFTGGEPLMHPDVVELVRAGTAAGMRMSLITNGSMLPKMARTLAEAGLAQVIVSLDGSSGVTHDVYRRSPGMFDSGLRGLREAAALGVLPRVNTVVGPHNYDQMPELQRVLTEAGVKQWELSALKLDRSIRYPDPDEVRAVCDPVYDADPETWLVPLGKRFYGDTPEEQERYFTESQTPRASRPLCHVVDDVIYVDGRNERMYACSCLPHREADGDVGGAPLRENGAISLDTPVFRAHADFFRDRGPDLCAGCSTTAAGYSDDVARLGTATPWQY